MTEPTWEIVYIDQTHEPILFKKIKDIINNPEIVEIRFRWNGLTCTASLIKKAIFASYNNVKNIFFVECPDPKSLFYAKRNRLFVKDDLSATNRQLMTYVIGLQLYLKRVYMEVGNEGLVVQLKNEDVPRSKL